MAEPDATRRALLTGSGCIGLGALVAPAILAQPPAEAETLARLQDLRELAATMRRERIPLLLFFSTPGCPYCLEVRRNYLAPRVREDAGKLLIREVDITSPRGVVDLSGERISERDLAARYKVRMTPVVQLVDADLKRLGRPLVGIDAAGFYDSYLGNAIEEAQRRLRAG